MMDMITLMENVEWIGGGNLRDWCDEDPTRYTLLREAMLMEKIDYEYEAGALDVFYQHYPELESGDTLPFPDLDPDPDPDVLVRSSPYPVPELGKSLWALDTELGWMLRMSYITIKAKGFKQWYYRTWPPKETVESHMSIDLAIAVLCSRDLYNGGDLAEKSATKQNIEIKKWLKNNHPDIQGQTKRHDRIMLIVKHGQ